MRKAGLALGIGAAGAVLLFSGIASASSGDETPPLRPKKIKPRRAVVAFTQRRSPFGKKWRIQIAETPAELLAMVQRAMGKKISMDAFLLGTLVSSEAGNQPDSAKIAIAYAAMSMANKLNVTLLRLLAPPALDGRLGGQLGGYASTARPPTAHDIEIGEGVTSGRLTNPTPGAIQWDSPSAQDKLVAKGMPGYKRSSEDVEQLRRGENKIPLYLADVSPRNLRLWRPAA